VAGKKIYAFNLDKVKPQVVRAFRKKGNKGTLADVVNYTGLPTNQVEETLPVVLKEYAGHLKVNDQGDVLYHFPQGMINQEKSFKNRFKRGMAKVLKVTKSVTAFLFKIWIMVMLVGYFALFLALFVAALVASVAASASGRDNNRRGGGFGAFYLSTRLIDLFIRVWFYSGMVRQRSKRGTPLHKSVFAYVFGENDPNAQWEILEKKLFFYFIRKHKGTITLEEFILLTGYDQDHAQDRLNRYLLEFEGEPLVTEEGHLIYSFPELLKTTSPLEEPRVKDKRFYQFNNNKKSLNNWITGINAFNIAFSGYFIYNTLNITEITGKGFSFFYAFVYYLFQNASGASPVGALFWGLGVIPLVFSGLFFLIPLLRNRMNQKKNDQIKEENYRKFFYGEYLSSGGKLTDLELKPHRQEDEANQWNKVKQEELNRLSLDYPMEIENKGTPNFTYVFKDLPRQLEDLRNFREQQEGEEYNFGKSVFDSGE